MYTKRWHCVQRVGLTEEEDKFVAELQELLGFRYRHQALRYIVARQMEAQARRDARAKSAAAQAKKLH